MRIVCHGRRMRDRAVAELIDALSLEALANDLRRDGYALQPVRAPRGLDRGRLTLRLTWIKTLGDVSYTVRQTVTLQQPDVV